MRPILTAAVFGIALALASSALSSATPRSRTVPVRVSTSERALLAEVNRVRAAHGLGALRADGRLIRAARAHTRSMLRDGRFAHGDMAGRLRRFGVRTGRVGENLAWGAGTYSSARAIVEMWLRSPRHRANLLRSGFRKIGLGTAVGPFAGYPDVTLVTANFQGT